MATGRRKVGSSGRLRDERRGRTGREQVQGGQEISRKRGWVGRRWGLSVCTLHNFLTIMEISNIWVVKV